MTEHDVSYLEEIKDLSAYELASMADCNSPDSLDSHGALLLSGVRNAVVEAWEYGSFDRNSDDDDGDVIHGIADNAPSVYSHPRALAFVDLCAYMEEPDDGEWSGTLVDMMGQALYQIADRLAHEVIGQIREAFGKWVCPDCGDTGNPRVCVPGECQADEEEQQAYRASQADQADQVPSVGIHPRPAIPEPVSDPILAPIAEVESAGKDGESSVTQQFMAQMSAANIAEFAERQRKIRNMRIAAAVLTAVVGLALIAYGVVVAL